MKYLRIVIFLLLITPILSWSVNAQFGVKVNYWRPTGTTLGHSLKPAFGPELMYIEDFDKALRTRVGISFVNYKPRVDTFFVYELEGSGNDFVVSKKAQTINYFRDFSLMAGMDYSPIDGEEAILPYLGVSVVVGYTQTSTSSYKSGFLATVNEDKNSYASIGLNARLGCEFWVNFGAVFIEYNGMFRYSPLLGYYVFNNFGLGFRF